MRRAFHIKSVLALMIMLAGGQELLAKPQNGKPADERQRAGLVAGASAAIAQNPYVGIPVIDAYHEGEKVWFIHDAEMAKRLTEMVGYATVHSPRLGEVDPDAVGKIYVFTNGISRKDTAPWGGGPFHYQIDVLDSVPGDRGYTPLRKPHTVN